MAAISLPGLAAAAQTGPASAEDGWLLKQQSSLGGRIDFTITDTAIRMDGLTCGFTVISRAPDWKICVYRTDTKEMGFLNLAQWRDWNTSTVGSTDECTLDKPISKKKITLQGLNLPAYLYTFPGEISTSALFQTEKPREFSCYLVQTCALSRAPQVSKLQCELFNCVPLDGVLMSCLGQLKDSQERNWEIRTISLKRLKAIPAATFSIPSTYKKLKSMPQQFKFKSMANSLDEMGGMLNLGESERRPRIRR